MKDQKLDDIEPGFIFQRVARQRIRLADKRLAPYQLTSAQAVLLDRLLRRDGMTQKELADRLGVGTVAVSGMVDRLEAAGLVCRGEDPNDRRAKTVWLKEPARTNKDLLAGIAKEINDVAFQGMTKDEIQQLLGLMDSIRENLAKALSVDDGADWTNRRTVDG